MELAKNKQKSLYCSLTLALWLTSAIAYGATPWENWKSVGQGKLTWAFWVIYDSELLTPSGRYKDDQEELALIIHYRRDIDRDDLLDATDDQWQHLGIRAEERKQWLRQLAATWPDIKEGDHLAFVLNQKGGRFYQDNRPLGQLLDREIASAFIDIWLSPDTSRPKLRRNLIAQ